MTTRSRLARSLALGAVLAALPGCMTNCYYDGPRPGSDFTAVAAETATGDASYTRTPFSFAIRYHGLEVDGVARTGFVSAFGQQPVGVDGFNWENLDAWPVQGQVVALQGYFAQQHPDWLCRTIELSLRPDPATGGASEVVCPNLEPGADPPTCGAAEFVVVTTNVLEYEDIFNEEVPEPDLFVSSDECEAADAQP